MEKRIEEKKITRRGTDANRDPITGTPGSHPVGTGIGAAAGGAAGVAGGMAAGAAAGTAGAGPIGGAVGAVVGAVVGGLAGKGVAEQVNPTEEDAYWKENYLNEPYYDRGYTYDDYKGAYRTGYEGFSRYGRSGKRYEDVETDLRRDYERAHGSGRLGWEKAKSAVKAAWGRVEHGTSRAMDRGTTTTHGTSHGLDLSRYIGYDVVDRTDNNIGTLDCLWADHNGEPAFVGVRTGWFLGKTHVVPAQSVEVNEYRQRLRLPYTEEKVKNAPAYDADVDMTEGMEQEIYSYYGLQPRTRMSQLGLNTPSTARSTGSTAMSGTSTTAKTPLTADTRGTTGTPRGRDEATIQLSEEQLRVSKREVEAGGVRLRKVIRTEIVNQPVELRREEVVIERVPAGQRTGAPRAGFQEQEVYIPLCREEAVVNKEVRVREEVRAHKESQTDTQHVSDRVRKEDVEIERTGEAKDKDRGIRGDRSR